MSDHEQIERVLNFEGNFEDAAEKLLRDLNLSPHKAMSSRYVEERYTHVQFQLGEALQPNGLVKLPSGNLEWSQYQGVMEIAVVTTRDADLTKRVVAGIKDVHRAWAAKIRRIMMQDESMPFDESSLPLYKVEWIRPSGTQFLVDEDRKTDTTVLRYAITFRIRPNAFSEPE